MAAKLGVAMGERRVEAIVIGPGAPGHLRVRFGQRERDVPADRIPGDELGPGMTIDLFVVSIGGTPCSVHASEQRFERSALVRSVNPGLTLRCQTKREVSSQFYAQVYEEW